MQKVQRRNYSKEFRAEVVSYYREKGESFLSTSRKFGVKKFTVASWILRSRQSENQRKSITFTSLKSDTMVKKTENPDSGALRLKSLEAELECERKRLKSLEAALKREQMRSNVWDKLIDVAERELQVNIRKKYGAKQFKRPN